MIVNTTDPNAPAVELREIGDAITYRRIAPLTHAVTIETAAIEGRNWYFEHFEAYVVRGGECVYPGQLITGGDHTAHAPRGWASTDDAGIEA